jgi:pimeloyl-ACP methyl ester carboxylesterase
MTAAPVWSTTAGLDDGRHIVLIHGSLDRSAGMLKLSRRLDHEFRVTRYDRRGYGRSLAVGGPFDIARQVDDLIAVLDVSARDGGPSIMFGHSFGGNVALATAERHPDRVAGVVTYETPLSWLDWWPSDTAGRQATQSTGDPFDAAERFMRRLVGDEVWERLPSATRAARRSEGPALIGELSAVSERAPWSPAAVQAPVLAMRGERCQPHHRQSTAAIAEWFGVPPVVIEGARHFGPNTHPDKVAVVVSEWVRGGFRAP